MSAGTDDVRRALAGSLVAGIAHDLNGRLGALLGVAHLARSAPLDEELLSVLDDQIRRLRESVVLLRSVPLADSRTEPREVPLSEAVANVVRLYSCRSGPELAVLTVEPDEGGAAALQKWGAALSEALLLVIAAAEQGRNGDACRVRVSYGVNGGSAQVRVQRCDDAARPASMPGGASQATVLETAAARLEAAGGRLEREEEDVFVLVLP